MYRLTLPVEAVQAIAAAVLGEVDHAGVGGAGEARRRHRVARYVGVLEVVVPLRVQNLAGFPNNDHRGSPTTVTATVARVYVRVSLLHVKLLAARPSDGHRLHMRNAYACILFDGDGDGDGEPPIRASGRIAAV